MRKPKSNNQIFSEADREKQCMEYLRSRGYGIFSLEPNEDIGEQEAVARLRAIGYKVDCVKNSTLRIDAECISTIDDIAVYFHEMMKRFEKDSFDQKKLRSRESRAVDRSIFNSLINWRVTSGNLSLREAIEEVFMMINITFERREEWRLDIRSAGIFSVSSNKPFIYHLLREINLIKDANISLKVDRLLKDENEFNYLRILQESRERMEDVTPLPRPARRKISLEE